MALAPLYIGEMHCLSPAGSSLDELWSSLFAEHSHLRNGLGSLPSLVEEELSALRQEKILKDQDKTILIALLLARRFKRIHSHSGVIIGSSRGATASLEAAFSSFSQGERLKSFTSPVTTASGLNSSVARDLALEGPSFSLSAACSTGLYAVIQGIASLRAGLAEEMLVGGIEAANTDFTREMMARTKVLSPDQDPYPCKPFAENRRGMVLSEGGALLSLSFNPHLAEAEVLGMGAANEASTLTGVSEDGRALQQAIRKALDQAMLAPSDIDLIVAHGAGTPKGDQAEREAYRKIFDGTLPPVVSHKWCSGHMLGASAALSVILGIHHLKHGLSSPHPYLDPSDSMRFPQKLRKSRYALISSMGFGGSACTLVVKNLS